MLVDACVPMVATVFAEAEASAALVAFTAVAVIAFVAEDALEEVAVAAADVTPWVTKLVSAVEPS